ncbi:Bone morphogenetic protein 3B [Dirofilaria immitis]|nr:Bone morphogenetic protein 3B [Dirofilaria immitis]
MRRLSRFQPNEKQIAILQKTVKELLDFKQLPDSVVWSTISRTDSAYQAILFYPIYHNVVRPNTSRIDGAASKYMLRLFNRYKENGDLKRQPLGNIVRSINPIIGTMFDEELLIFKLNAIKPNEQVIQAELHYNIHYKRRFIWKQMREIVKVIGIFKNNTKAQTIRLAPITISHYWLSFNMTNLITEALQANQTIIAAKIKCTELIKRNTPFLLIHANEPMLADRIKFQSAFNAKTMPNLHIDAPSEMTKKRSKRMSQYYVYSAKEKYDGAGDNLEQTERHLKKFRDLGPRILRDRKQERSLQRRKQQKLRSTFRNDPMMGFGMKKNLPRKFTTLPPTPFIEEKRMIMMMLQWYYFQGILIHCRIEKLNVRFRDIGWEHWIIAPTSFEAHYCSVNPSNHAIVQSIIHRLGLNPYVPDVCCAPDKMDSLTLLYYDEMDNVVLKNYPRMIVNSCACL